MNDSKDWIDLSGLPKHGKNKGIHSTVEIGNEVGLTKSTVRKYLKMANGLNLCTYNIEIVNKYRAKKISKTRKKT